MTSASCICKTCDKPFPKVHTRLYCSPECKAQSERERARRRPFSPANSRNQGHRRRAIERVTDVRKADIAALLSSRTYCPLCRRRMTDKHDDPYAKQIDHIIPMYVGGTHTLGNIRVLCRTCNLKRPKDGSDVVGQVTLWAQDIAAAPSLNDLALRKAERQQRTEQRAEERRQHQQRAARERHERVAGKAAIALALRLQGHKWCDVATHAGYQHAVSARSAVIYHWPNAEADILRRTKARGKAMATQRAVERYTEITDLRANGQTWAQIASDLGYANARSARRCFRGFRDTARGSGGSGIAHANTPPDSPVSNPPPSVERSEQWA